MTVFQQLKRLFHKLTPIELVVRELNEAELAKLEAETGSEWANASVAYNSARIKRLKARLAQLSKESS